MGKLPRLAIIACLTIPLAGCMSFELEGDGDLTTQSATGTETVHGSLYGFMWQPHEIQKCSDSLGIYRVEYHTNALFLLASACSLGLYVPQTVEWWCQAPEPEDDGDILGPPDDAD